MILKKLLYNVFIYLHIRITLHLELHSIATRQIIEKVNNTYLNILILKT